MSMFNWFSGKSGASKNNSAQSSIPLHRASGPDQALDRALPPVSGPGLLPHAPMVDRKVKRHARREQLYVAIRESMTRAGVLSASYKFKVLSLDHNGDQFLVMMDVASGLDNQAGKLTEIESLLISTAKSLFSIYVTSVYWRTDSRPAAVNGVNFGVSQPAALDAPAAHPQAPGPAATKSAVKSAARFDPIHDDEMAAFKQALKAASEHSPATPDGSGKSRSGLRSLTLFTGFEDTEMPESSTAPVLSATQYGELR